MSKERVRNSAAGGADAGDLVQFADDVDSKLMLGSLTINEAERENLMRELQRECEGGFSPRKKMAACRNGGGCRGVR